MATEKSDPQTGLILKLGAVAVISLLLIRAGLVAYFDDIAKAEEQRKIGDAKPEALMSLRADEQQRLTTGPLSIDKAKEQMAAQGRMGASPMVVPSISKDVAPLQGWTKMPSEAPAAMMAPSAPPSESPSPGATPSAVDAGGVSSDAAAPRAIRPDAAAPKAPAPPKHP